MSESRESQETESNYSGKISHVPSQQGVIPSPRSMPSREKRLHLIHGICLNHRETFLAIHAHCSIHHRHLFKKSFTLRLQGTHFPNFEVQDARNASALNKMIQNSNFKKKVCLEEQKEDRFLRGRQIAYMIYDYFRVTGAHDTVLDNADLFPFTLRNDDVQDFDTRWDEILFSMTKIPPYDLLWKVCTN